MMLSIREYQIIHNQEVLWTHVLHCVQGICLGLYVPRVRFVSLFSNIDHDADK